MRNGKADRHFERTPTAIGEGKDMRRDLFACPCCGFKTLTAPPPGTREICPVCFWEDTETDASWERSNRATLIEAQRNYEEFGAAERAWVADVRPPLEHEARDPGWQTIEAFRETLKRSLIEKFEATFMYVPRPRHFTNYEHCCECWEHNELMCSRTPMSLKLEDVDNPCWNPLCFLTPDAFRYWLPTLVRLGFSADGAAFLGTFVSFHLREDNCDRFATFTVPEAQLTLELVQSIRHHFPEIRDEAYPPKNSIEKVEQFWMKLVEQKQRDDSESPASARARGR
jgi:hypothetical protein